MRILSLSFGRTARTPALRGYGVAITPTREPERDPGLVIYGACRASRADVPPGKLELPRGIVLVAADSGSGRTAVVNLVGERLVFEDDVEEERTELLTSFRCVVDPSISMAGPFFLHASFHQHLSDVFWVTP
jgi:hypothetical protein